MTKEFSTIAKNGMVTSSQPLATLAGVQILMSGGNAIDAAVAAAAVLGVVEPSSLGIGGDAFALFYSAKEKVLKGVGRERQIALCSQPGLLSQERF